MKKLTHLFIGAMLIITLIGNLLVALGHIFITRTPEINYNMRLTYRDQYLIIMIKNYQEKKYVWVLQEK